MHKWPKRLLLGSTALLSASLPAMAGEPVSPTKLWNEIWQDVLYDMLFIGLPFALAAIYFLIRYRAKHPGQVGEPVRMNAAATWGWIIIPCALFLADDLLLFGKGWTLWNVQRVVPANALEIKVNAVRWSFQFDYGNGVTDSELVVPVGQPIVLRMTAKEDPSGDVIHSFGLVDFRLKEDLIPGRVTYLWFIADKPQETRVNCMEFCGTGHGQMSTPVRAVSKEEYQQWLAKHKSASAGTVQVASASLGGTASK